MEAGEFTVAGGGERRDMRVKRDKGWVVTVGVAREKSQVKLTTVLLTRDEPKQRGEKVIGRMKNGYSSEEIALNHMWFLTAFRNQRY